MRSITAFFITVLLAFTAMHAMANSNTNPSGTWKISLVGPNGQTYYPEATVKENGSNLGGSYYSPTYDQTLELQDVRLESNNTLHFTVSTQGLTVAYAGNVEGNKLSGSARLDYQGQQYDAGFTAVREAQGGGLAGTWNSKTERQGQTGTATLILTAGSDGKISGTIEARRGPSEIKDGNLDDGVFTFSTEGQYQGYDYVANYRGLVEGDEIKGELIITAASVGQTRKFSWTAKKAD